MTISLLLAMSVLSVSAQCEKCSNEAIKNIMTRTSIRRIPIDRTTAQFKHQSSNDKASSNEEAFFHSVWFSPHQISINLPFFLASSIHLGTISSRNFCFFSFNFCISRPIAC